MPKNIRYGVTITPPGGEPVTGTAYPVDSDEMQSVVGFNYNGDAYMVIGNPIDGIAISTSGNTFTIKGSKLISGYIVCRSGVISFNGDYTNSAQPDTIGFAYIPPTQLNSGITVSLVTSSLESCLVTLFEVESTELVPSNIVGGVTINGVSGTMKGGELTMKLLTDTASRGRCQFFTSAGETSSNTSDQKQVNNIPENSGSTFGIVNNGYSGISAYVNNAPKNITQSTNFDNTLTQVSIGNVLNYTSTYSVGCFALFYK